MVQTHGFLMFNDHELAIYANYYFQTLLKYYTNVFSSCMQRKLPQEVCVPLHSVSLLGTS